MEESHRAGDVTDGSTLQRMLFLCWIPMAADTYLEYIIVIALIQ